MPEMSFDERVYQAADSKWWVPKDRTGDHLKAVAAEYMRLLQETGRTIGETPPDYAFCQRRMAACRDYIAVMTDMSPEFVQDHYEARMRLP